MSNELPIGLAKNARRAWALDDVAVVPSRRTRSPQDVSLEWQIDAYKFDMPVIGAPMDSVMSPATAIALGKLGGLGVLNLEGLWTRYENPEPILEEIAALEASDVSPENTQRLQELYAEPIKAELITARLAEIREAGVVVSGSLTPQRTQEFYQTVVDAGVDMFVIRGTTVSAEHVTDNGADGTEPLNLKKFIYELDVPVIVGGAAGYTPALHLMRTGAAGVLVGFGGGSSTTTRRALGIRVPMATAISDIAAARRDYLDESGGRYVHVIADGGLGTSGDIVKALAMGADAVMLGATLARAEEAPGRGWHWGLEAVHEEFPRGHRTHVGTVGPLEEVLWGPSHHTDGTSNLMGGLKRAMATTGYVDVKSFQRVDAIVSPLSQQDR
ncbi:GuaB3 family IMP dehydrogenase-related protein [Nesterenkonia lacusekhoensis]|uniref:IMP dehydrogenase n=1 Tax=Nesterenkonia lacusekhoensis TaxID=150832 RepID=A0ABS4SYQ6_9MICC|nr:GuaB3 family IMP dehydrogenase-related protein [Nesterenkonia lacusekhoensis]MBP2317326.1 IMP dehydrogenase [Nesterenkonia lacusekhoensis]